MGTVYPRDIDGHHPLSSPRLQCDAVTVARSDFSRVVRCDAVPDQRHNHDRGGDGHGDDAIPPRRQSGRALLARREDWLAVASTLVATATGMITLRNEIRPLADDNAVCNWLEEAESARARKRAAPREAAAVRERSYTARSREHQAGRVAVPLPAPLPNAVRAQDGVAERPTGRYDHQDGTVTSTDRHTRDSGSVLLDAAPEVADPARTSKADSNYQGIDEVHRDEIESAASRARHHGVAGTRHRERGRGRGGIFDACGIVRTL